MHNDPSSRHPPHPPTPPIPPPPVSGEGQTQLQRMAAYQRSPSSRLLHVNEDKRRRNRWRMTTMTSWVSWEARMKRLPNNPRPNTHTHTHAGRSFRTTEGTMGIRQHGQRDGRERQLCLEFWGMLHIPRFPPDNKQCHYVHNGFHSGRLSPQKRPRRTQPHANLFKSGASTKTRCIYTCHMQQDASPPRK